MGPRPYDGARLRRAPVETRRPVDSTLVEVGSKHRRCRPRAGRAPGAGAGWAVGYGLLTGVIIAAYTPRDRRAVSVLAVPPLLPNWENDLGRAILPLPRALRRRAQARALWRARRC